MTETKHLCKVPEFIEFQFYPEQEMHAFIQIENLTDQIVSFKIKTNTPTEYLVKPMEGQIYKKQKMKIVFRRKKISQEAFDDIQSGAKPIKQKFMINITCKSKNPIGIEKTDEQINYMAVRFSNTRRSQSAQSPVKTIKKAKTNQQKKQQSDIKNLINQQRSRLDQLKQQRLLQQNKLESIQNSKRSFTATTESPSFNGNQLTLSHIVCLIVIFLILGMWI